MQFFCNTAEELGKDDRSVYGEMVNVKCPVGTRRTIVAINQDEKLKAQHRGSLHRGIT